MPCPGGLISSLILTGNSLFLLIKDYDKINASPANLSDRTGVLGFIKGKQGFFNVFDELIKLIRTIFII